ncbi:hypothetical protein [Dokdonella sp.]|uniref:hypothetical protein n=1 Tax=Dokdonella sp. TaxID=2291710 RepID=UPI0031C293E2|nr:hypothetical protein [Dokdonella sp.]
MSRMLIPFLMLGLAACSASYTGGEGDGGFSKVNGAVKVEAGQQAGDVSTVNGAIQIGEGAQVAKASTVNGAIHLGPRSQAKQINTVNGSISLGEGARVDGDIGAVNGGIRLARGSEVTGKLHNVNGTIVLEAARVDGGIETTGGDITVGADSHVGAGILVDKPGGWSFGFSRDPRIVIGPGAVVDGTLEFRRSVELLVSDQAKIGPVKGATAKMFSGDTP